jgi:hypothetical protein
VTGGTHSGLMKLVGEARAQYNPTALLIGFCALGAVEHGCELRNAHANRGETHALLHASFPYLNCSDRHSLDSNHSHFILVDDQTNGQEAFGCERGLRAHFESCMASSLDAGYPQYELHGLPDERASGLKWANVGCTQPTFGRELDNPELAHALTEKTDFKQKEWDEFEISMLRYDDFIQVGECYFKPAEHEYRQYNGRHVLDAHMLSATSALQAITLWEKGVCVNGRIAKPELTGKATQGFFITRLHSSDQVLRNEYRLNPRPKGTSNAHTGYWCKIEHNHERTVCSALQAIWMHAGNGTPKERAAGWTASTGQRIAPSDVAKKINEKIQHLKDEQELKFGDKTFASSVTWKDIQHSTNGDEKASKEKAKVHAWHSGHKSTGVHASSSLHSDVTAAEILDVDRLTKALIFRHSWKRDHKHWENVLLDVEKQVAEYFAEEDKKRESFGKLKTTITNKLRRFFNLGPQEVARLFTESIDLWRLRERDVIVFTKQKSDSENSLPMATAFSVKLKNLKRMSADRVNHVLEKELRAHANGFELDDQEPEDSSFAQTKIASVSICVQGGPGSVETALRTTQAGIPSLFVRSSGKAADLISDAVLLRYTSIHPAFVKHRSSLQSSLWDFFVLCGVRSDPNDKQTAVYSWDVVIGRITDELIRLDGVESASSHFEHSATLCDQATALISGSAPSGYEIQTEFSDDQAVKICLKVLRQAVQTGESELVFLGGTVLVSM